MRQNIRYIGLLFICILVLCAGTVSAKEITVSTGSGNSTINAALSNATDGDIIIVTNGTYSENIIVNRSVTIRSVNGPENTIIQAASIHSHIFNVRANNVTINGFNVTGTTNYTGIYLYSVSDCNISNNRVSENYAGIYLERSNNAIISNNQISSNTFGIYLDYSSNATLTSNMMSSNAYNFGIYGSELGHSLHNIDESNKVDDKKLYYLIGQADVIVPYDAGQVYAVSSTNITVKDISISNAVEGITLLGTNNSTIENVTFSQNSCGIALYYSGSNTIDNVNVNDNYYGIYTINSTNNTLINSKIDSNEWNGIFLSSSSNNNTIENNLISSSALNGIYLHNSVNNTLSKNTIIDNSESGIDIYHSDNNSVLYNTLTNNTYDGIRLNVSVYNNLISNNITLNGWDGINITLSNYTLVSHNVINSSTDHGIRLEQSDSNNMTINILTQNYNGLHLIGSDNNIISGNNATSNDECGIYLYGSSNNNLTNNNASDNFDGIFLSTSINNTLSNNNASDNYNGIILLRSSSNTLNQNTMSSNNLNFVVSSPSTEEYFNDIAVNNSVDTKPVYYLVNSSNMTVPSDAGVVYAINSTNITVSGAHISNEAYGIIFIDTDNSTIENATVYNCDYGISLDISSNCNLTDNNASDNDYGIYLYKSTNNNLTDNTAGNNGLGILLDKSNNNDLTNNTATDSMYGILLEISNNNDLTNNTATDSMYGIFLGGSTNNNLTGNNANDNDIFGIMLGGSSSNTLAQNIMSDNLYNFLLECSSTEDYYNDINTTNLVDGKPVYYLVNSSNMTVPSDAGVVYAINSTNITVAGVQISNEAYGIMFVETDNSTIENVTVSDCGYGIMVLYNSDNNTFTDNTVIDNDYAIVLQYSSSYMINDLTVTEDGAELSFSEDVEGIDTAIAGRSSSSRTFAGKSNVNGYVNIARRLTPVDDSIGTLSTESSELSTEGLVFVHDDFLETFEPFARTSFFTSDGISVDSLGAPIINTDSPDINMSVTFSYDDSGMSSSDESSIDLYIYNGGTWMLVNGTSLDTSNNSISVTLSEFGTFALFKEASSHSSNPTGGDFNIRLPDEGEQSQETVTTTTTTLSVNSNGEVTSDTVVESSDSATTLTLYEGTVGTDSSGNPVTEITISRPSSMPENTPDYVLESGLYYDYGPSGTTFSKKVMISIEFDPAEYEGKDPVIYTYSEEDGWIALETTIDRENGVATAYTTHFSLYALFGAGGEEDIQDSAESSDVGEGGDVPVEQNASTGYHHAIFGVCIILGLAVVVINKNK